MSLGKSNAWKLSGSLVSELVQGLRWESIEVPPLVTHPTLLKATSAAVAAVGGWTIEIQWDWSLCLTAEAASCMGSHRSALKAKTTIEDCRGLFGPMESDEGPCRPQSAQRTDLQVPC